MNQNGYEIERKFLICRPEEAWLEKNCQGSDIVQTYLKSEAAGRKERVRRREGKNGVVYTHTRKRRLSDLRREEQEREISEAEYRALLQRADPARRIRPLKQGAIFRLADFPLLLFPTQVGKAALSRVGVYHAVLPLPAAHPLFSAGGFTFQIGLHNIGALAVFLQPGLLRPANQKLAFDFITVLVHAFTFPTGSTDYKIEQRKKQELLFSSIIVLVFVHIPQCVYCRKSKVCVILNIP